MKMQDNTRVTAALSATFAVLTMGNQSAIAQSTNATVTLEEVIITAERREADLQKTAASVTVVTGEQLAEQGKYSLQDILQNIPGVSGGAALGFGGTGSDNVASGITIRGIGSNIGGGGETVSTSSTAAVYVDGVYEGTGGNYDIERVEVLRGPQGTLYGRSATSGLVAIHTRNPDLSDFGGDVTAEAGNYQLRHYSAAVNVPIVSDVLAIRVAGNRYEREGLRGAFNAATGEAEGGPGGTGTGPSGAVETTEGRIKLLYRPIEALSILVGVAIQNNDTHSGGVTNLASNDRNVVLWESAPLASAENKYRQYWAQIDWDIGFGTLTYQPAYRSWTQHGNAITQDIFTIDTLVDTPEDTFWTHELRLASSPNSKLAWQTGILSYDNDVQNFNEWRFVPSYDLFSSRDTDKSTEAVGVFAEATYPIANTWRVTAGVRYDHTEVAVRQHYVSAFPPPPGEDLIPNSAESGKRKFNNWNYKLRAEHDFTPENMVYASISTGFSPGDVSLAGCGSSICVVDLDAETLTAYEIGSKNRFLDNRLQVNGAIFYNDYGAYQTGNLDINSNDNDPFNLAFASLAVPVQAYGIELELLYQITVADRLGLNAGYTNARYVDKPLIFALNNARDTLGNSPLTANLSYDHVFNLPGGWTWNVHGDVQYLSAHDGNLNETQKQNGGEAFVRIDAETIGNFSTTVAAGGGRFSMTGWVRNVADNQYIQQVNLNNNAQPFSFRHTLYDPRTFGVSASLKF